MGAYTSGRSLGNHQGSFFVDGSMFGEQRHNGTVLQRNSTTIRQLSTGLDWNSAEAGRFAVRVFGGTENYRQNFSSISDWTVRAESLTRDQSVPVYQLGGSLVWSRTVGRPGPVAGIDLRKINGETDEIGFFGGKPTSRLQAGGQQHTVGVFFEDLVRITPNWLLTGSARVDRSEQCQRPSLTTPLSGAAKTLCHFPIAVSRHSARAWA